MRLQTFEQNTGLSKQVLQLLLLLLLIPAVSQTLKPDGDASWVVTSAQKLGHPLPAVLLGSKLSVLLAAVRVVREKNLTEPNDSLDC